MKIDNSTVWYVVAGKKSDSREENYPLLIYADKDLAKAIADANNEKLIMVKPILGQ